MKYAYFPTADGYRTYNLETDEITTMDRLPRDSRLFHMFIGYEPTTEGLLKFVADFRQWTTELATPKQGYLKIEYTNYYCHAVAVESTLKRISGSIYKRFEKVDKLENSYIQLCFNGGLLYCKPYEGPSFGYDYKSYYPTCLSADSLLIPTKKGYETYTDIKHYLQTGQTLPHGYYYVIITSYTEHVNKVFSFSKHNVYTNYSIEFAYKHRKQFGFKFAFWPEEDGYNSYIYRNEDLIKSSSVFKNWKTRLLNLRKLYPKNKLLKHLLSSVAGSLTKYKKMNKTLEEIIQENLDVSTDDEGDYKIVDHIINNTYEHYQLYKTEDPYYYGIARLKAFLMSFARNRIASTAIWGGIEDVIRIHTDNVTFKENKDEKMSTCRIEKEPKTTGNLKWTVVNAQPTKI